ncbi:MAG: hypothetical protein ACTHOE_06790 [Conexibacter sp.]
MAGGIAILLLIIILLVVGGIALALYGTGGFLWFRKTDPQRDRIADVTEDASDERSERRPQHTRPTTAAQERTDFVGREARHHG